MSADLENISMSAENYLEAIYRLGLQLPVVRSVDVARELHFTKPSVSIGMKNLRAKGLITVEHAGFIYLTETGLAIARRTYERHIYLTRLLTELGVDPATAEEDACRMEHVISPASFEAVKNRMIAQGIAPEMN